MHVVMSRAGECVVYMSVHLFVHRKHTHAQAEHYNTLNTVLYRLNGTQARVRVIVSILNGRFCVCACVA